MKTNNGKNLMLDNNTTYGNRKISLKNWDKTNNVVSYASKVIRMIAPGYIFLIMILHTFSTFSTTVPNRLPW